MKLSGLIFILLLISSTNLFSQQIKIAPAKDNDELYHDDDDDAEEDKSLLKNMIRDKIYPGSDSKVFNRYIDEMMDYHKHNPQKLAANWTSIGTGNVNVDVGRTTSITFDTINSGRFYVCSNNSGVWLTNNNGVSYTPITEALPVQSVSCLVIDPSNTDVLYLATGTHNGDMLKNSIGVYKSVDGGLTWNATGLTFMAGNEVCIGSLVINPLNHNSLLAATTDGLYRTYDGGQTWTNIISDAITSVCFKPNDTNYIHATGLTYYRSDNAGTTFTVTTGYFNSFTYNYEHYVLTTAANPGVVYLISNGLTITPAFNPRFYIYQSTDDGISFSLYDSLAGEVASQVNVSQLHADKFIAGYRQAFKKENALNTFQPMTAWYPNTAANYMHADQRGMFFDPHNDSIIYSCNDGGLYRSTDNGITFQNITANMQLAHLYTMSNADSSDYKLLASSLDVSPYMVGSTGITQTFTLFVESFSSRLNKLNDNKFYITHQTPLFTTDNGSTFYGSTSPMIGNTSYHIHNFNFDNCNENISYYGSYNDVYKSTDNGLTYGYFVRTQCNPTNSFTREQQGFEVSRANPRYIYVYYTDSVYVTTDGTNAFNNITAGLPVSSAVISHLAVDPADEKKIWVSFSGYSAGNKVFYSDNAGQTWTNVSAGLPNIPVNALICQRGVAGAVYAGTDGGVFYRDSTFSSWQYFNTGLPNVIVTALDMQYNIGKIRCSTFGRGLWESDFYQPTPAGYLLPPVASFEAASVHACPGQLITLDNTSCGVIDSVLWLFPGGIPSSSTSFAPAVSFATPGVYTVTLIAYNSGGADTLTKNNYIEVTGAVPVPYNEPVSYIPGLTDLPTGCYTTEVNFDDISWLRWWWVDNISGNIDGCLVYDNFDHNLNGQSESLIFPSFDLSGIAHPKLYFSRSYERNSTVLNDTLKIFAKICGGANTEVYSRGGAQLATVGGFNSANYWQPTLFSDWVSDSVDLTAFAGQQNVTVEFSNKGYGGQILYLDNFSVQNSVWAGIRDNSSSYFVSVYPNPASGTVTLTSNSFPMKNIKISDVLGKLIYDQPSAQSNRVAIDISHLSKGIYFLEVTNDRKDVVNRKLVVK